MARDKETPRDKVLSFLQEHEGELLRISDIAVATNLQWLVVLKEITYLLFDYLTEKHSELLKKLPVKPEKKWDDWLVVPQLAEEVA